MTPREKADKAKQWLTDPLFGIVMADIREQLVKRLEATSASDLEEMQRITITLKVMQEIQSVMQRYVDEVLIADKRADDDSFVRRMRQKLRA